MVKSNETQKSVDLVFNNISNSSNVYLQDEEDNGFAAERKSTFGENILNAIFYPFYLIGKLF